MGKIPKKAIVTSADFINMSNGEKLILKDKLIEIHFALKEDDHWLCSYQGKEFTIDKKFLSNIEYEEFEEG